MKSNKDKNNEYKFSISVGEKKIVCVKSRYDKLDDENKTIILNEMMYWTRQQLNNIQPEQE